MGCDVGIYYRDSTMSSWIAYNTGLPNVSVRDLEIFYPLGKLRAATFGRGVWEADLYNNGTLAPIANFTADKTFICAGMQVNYTDLSSFVPTAWNWVFQNGTPATSTSQNPATIYNTPGTYSVSLTATNGNGNNTMTKTLYIVVSPINALPLVEGFQSATFPPTNWQNYDASNDNLKWQRIATVGKASTASIYYDNYDLDAAGTRDEMRTPKYDFSSFTQAKLYFDVAYAQYSNTYSDSLAIMVSNDCGLTFSQVYVKGGTTLATGPNDTTKVFTPTATQWRTDTVSLNAFVGMSNVMIAFQNRGHYGQAIYIDNVNISGANSNLPPVAAFSNSNPPCSSQGVTFTDQSSNIPNAWSWSFPGGTPTASSLQNPLVSFASSGTYTISLTATNAAGTSVPTTQTITVNATPTVSVTASSPTICLGQKTVLTGSGATTYSWAPGSHTGASYTVTPTATTTYTLTGATLGCANTATVSVSTKQLPTVVIATSHDTVCMGNSAMLNASGASTYSWSPTSSLNNSNGPSVIASPTVTTLYTVIGTDTGTCSNKSTHTIVVSNCTGINSISQYGVMGIYPNPNNGAFVIDVPQGISGIYIIEIRNAISQLIYTDKIQVSGAGVKKEINISKESKGVYSLTIQSGQAKVIRKIIVE